MMADRLENEKLNHIQGSKIAAKETICWGWEDTSKLCVQSSLVLAFLGGWPINVSGNRSLDIYHQHPAFDWTKSRIKLIITVICLRLCYIYWSCQRVSTKASRVLVGLQESRLTHIRPAHLLILRAASECRPAPDSGNTVVTLHSFKGDLYQKAECSPTH